MRREEIEGLIEAADPVDRDAVAGLPLGEAKRELYEAIVARPQEGPRRVGAASPGSPPALPRRSRLPRLAIAAVAALAVLGAFISGLFDGSSGSGTALAAARQRLARVSPHLLLEAPGWEMQAAEQSGAGEGRIEFAVDDLEQHGFLGGRLQIETQSVARLTWRVQSPQAPRGRDGRQRTVATAQVPGARALVRAFGREEISGLPSRRARELGLPAERSFSAVWLDAGLHLRLDSTAPNAESFVRLLGSLRKVQGPTWLRALPRRMKLIGGRPIAGIPLAEWQIAFHCGPLSAALTAREDPALVAYFRHQCHQ
jgi:hypothetical protein